jgi:membrane protein implicated in regulation of membrane protease activity
MIMRNGNDLIILAGLLLTLVSISAFGVMIRFILSAVPLGAIAVLAVVCVIVAVFDVGFLRQVWREHHQRKI